MYHAIIVDDEILFLRYLKEQVQWDKYRISIDRTFSSAQLALDYLRTDRSIDVVFTDIKMPVMNGIDLIRSLPRELKMHAYIMVLSGYDDFQLVREAFLAGASDYMLKVDVNTPQFDKTVGQLLEFLDARQPDAQGDAAEAPPNLPDTVKQYVRDNLSQPLALNDLAAHFGFSPGYLSQLFSHGEGVTLSDYIISQRIARARELLRDTGRAITEISYDVGFNSPEHFSRTFRKLTGVSPRQYREQGAGG